MIGNYTLITNLEWVTVAGVRTFTHALLLSDHEDFFTPTARKLQLRGFGTDPAWPTFDLDVQSLEHTLVDARSGAVIVTDEQPEGRPLCTGAIMQLRDGPRVDLITCRSDKALDVRTYRDVSILQVWADLPRLVRRYWSPRADMPSLVWGRP